MLTLYIVWSLIKLNSSTSKRIYKRNYCIEMQICTAINSASQKGITPKYAKIKFPNTIPGAKFAE